MLCCSRTTERITWPFEARTCSTERAAGFASTPALFAGQSHCSPGNAMALFC
jgi:hypothetical protein